MIVVILLGVVNAGLIPHEHSIVLQGPSSKTTLVRSDDSHNSGHSPGGQVATIIDVGHAAHSGNVESVVVPIVDHIEHVATPVSVEHDKHTKVDVTTFESKTASVESVPSKSPAVKAHIASEAPVGSHPSVLQVEPIDSSTLISHNNFVFDHDSFDDDSVDHDSFDHDDDSSIHDDDSVIEGKFVQDFAGTYYDDHSYKNHHH